MDTNNKNKKSGRPTKAEEFRTFELGQTAIEEEFGSEASFWSFIALESRESRDHLKMLIEYTYGKAPNKIDVTGTLETFNTPDWFTEIAKEEEDEEQD